MHCPDQQFSLLCSLNQNLPVDCQDYLLDGKEGDKSGLSPTGMHHLPQKVLLDLPALEVFQPSYQKML